MLAALVGFWIGTTTLVFTADGIYLIGGASLLDQPMHGGHWTIHGDVIEFKPDPVKRDHKIEEALFPRSPFRCAYTLSSSELDLSACPYEGGYVRFKSRRARELP